MKKEITWVIALIFFLASIILLILYLDERSLSNFALSDTTTTEEYNALMGECNQLNDDWNEAYNTLNNCYSNDLPTCNTLTPNWG